VPLAVINLQSWIRACGQGIAKTAIFKQWGQRSKEITTALEEWYKVELEFTGDFIVH
jgi:hypothetical protein